MQIIKWHWFVTTGIYQKIVSRFAASGVQEIFWRYHAFLLQKSKPYHFLLVGECFFFHFYGELLFPCCAAVLYLSPVFFAQDVMVQILSVSCDMKELQLSSVCVFSAGRGRQNSDAKPWQHVSSWGAWVLPPSTTWCRISASAPTRNDGISTDHTPW